MSMSHVRIEGPVSGSVTIGGRRYDLSKSADVNALEQTANMIMYGRSMTDSIQASDKVIKVLPRLESLGVNVYALP